MNEVNIKNCKGEKCESAHIEKHSVECLFEHFAAYTSLYKEAPDVQDKIKKAYFDGYDACLNIGITGIV